MLTVACVLKSGGIYDATWVARLKKGVENNLPINHQFVCLSDMDVPCHRIPLFYKWPGWWSKIELFTLPPPVLYFDLDTLIVGDLSDIAKFSGFTMLRDFYDEKHKNSSVMAWETSATVVYYKFSLSPAQYMDEYRKFGDQRFIEDVMATAHCWQDKVPGQIVSYKADNCQIKAPDNARVVCLHGLPKFGDMPKQSWAREMWEKAA